MTMPDIPVPLVPLVPLVPSVPLVPEVPEVEVPRVPVLSEAVLNRYKRGVWAVCVVVYLAVFLGGLHGGGAELTAVGRAVAFTLVAALLGRMALGLLARATQPGEPVPMAVPERKVGSLVDLLASTNVPEQVEEAEAA